jgi:hypothetical protein
MDAPLPSRPATLGVGVAKGVSTVLSGSPRAARQSRSVTGAPFIPNNSYSGKTGEPTSFRRTVGNRTVGARAATTCRATAAFGSSFTK